MGYIRPVSSNGFKDPTRIADDCFAATARIKSESLDATLSGTAFFYEVESVPYLVTNRHLLEGSEKLTISFAARDPSSGERIPGTVLEKVIQDGELSWYKHPNEDIDVAAVQVADALDDLDRAGTPAFWAAFDQESSFDAAGWAELDAVEAVNFVGYPHGISTSATICPSSGAVSPPHTSVTTTRACRPSCLMALFLRDRAEVRF